MFFLLQDLIPLSEEDNEVVTKLFAEVEKISQEEPENFKSLFIQQQQKALTCADNRGRRWHPLIIRWCFQLYSSSPKAYQFLKDTGVLLLPDKRTLRDYSNCFKVGSGLDSGFLDLVKKDFNNRSDPKDSDVWVGIIHDEVSLRKDLVFDDSGKLIGFVDLGSVQNSIDDLEQCLSAEQNSPITPEEATHMFVFMVVSLFSDWRMPVAFFPTTTIKSYALFNLFWKCIEELEQREFRVLTSTCDGASPHRLFYKYHIPPGAPKGTIIYKTNNHYAFEKRPLYFICDPVHLLKTTRNNWENSFWRNKTKKLRNNGMWITWLQLIDAFENDVNSSNVSGLRLLHKLTADHIFLNPYLRMRVYLAAQVFSNRVAHAITEQGKPGTEETVKFVQNMNDFFDCLNANRIYTQYEFKSVYRTPTDRRLHWLENDFLKYFQDWKDWAMGQEDVPLLERKQYFISDQTWEGLQICVKSFVEVVKFSLNIPGVNFVVATKFNQDLLEKFFGKLRQKRGAYGAFTCKEFSQSYSNCVFSQSHAIKTVRRIKRRGDALEDLDADLPLPKNKRR